MFDIGLQEMLVIGVLALLIFGPSKLPELGRMVGRGMRELRRASDEFRSTVETNLQINEPDPPAPMSPEPASTAAATLPSEAEPVVVEAAGDTTATAVAERENGEPYVAQRGARLFHRRECAWTRRIPEADRAYFKRVIEAREQGWVECPACEPWEPA